MNPIELTAEHKSKLVEMCSIVFSEMQNIAKENTIKWCSENHEYIDDCEYGFRLSGERSPRLYCSYPIDYDFHVHLLPNDENPGIHWFEFCMTHLVVRLSGQFGEQGLSKSDYTKNQYPNWFSEKIALHLNPFRNEKFEEDVKFIHPIDYLYEQFKQLKQ